MGDEAFEREMKATRGRLSLWGAPYSIAVGGFCMGIAFTTVLFLLLLNEERNWLMLVLLSSLSIQGIWMVITGVQTLKSARHIRG